MKTAELRTYLRERYGVPGNQAVWYPHITNVFVAAYATIETDYERNAETDSHIRELCQRVLEFDSLQRVDVLGPGDRTLWACQRPDD